MTLTFLLHMTVGLALYQNTNPPHDCSHLITCQSSHVLEICFLSFSSESFLICRELCRHCCYLCVCTDSVLNGVCVCLCVTLLSPSRFPMPPRPPSVHSTASSTDSEDCDENYVAMVSKADELVCNTRPQLLSSKIFMLNPTVIYVHFLTTNLSH